MVFETLKTEYSVLLIAVRAITMLTVSISERHGKYMILGTGVWLNSEAIL